MFKLNQLPQDFAFRPNLYCVWIRANERPNAPLVCVWIDRRMSAFETPSEERHAGLLSTPASASDPDHPASFASSFALELAAAGRRHASIDREQD